MNKQKEKELLKNNYPRNVQQYIERELFFYNNTKKIRKKTLRDAKLEFAENVLGAMTRSKNEDINYIVINRKSYSRRNETNSYMKCIISFIDYCIVINEENQKYFEKTIVELEKMYEDFFQDYHLKRDVRVKLDDILSYLIIETEKDNYYLTEIFEILLKYGIDIMLNKTQVMLNFQKSFKRRIGEKTK